MNQTHFSTMSSMQTPEWPSALAFLRGIVDIRVLSPADVTFLHKIAQLVHSYRAKLHSAEEMEAQLMQPRLEHAMFRELGPRNAGTWQELRLAVYCTIFVMVANIYEQRYATMAAFVDDFYGPGHPFSSASLSILSVSSLFTFSNWIDIARRYINIRAGDAEVQFLMDVCSRLTLGIEEEQGSILGAPNSVDYSIVFEAVIGSSSSQDHQRIQSSRKRFVAMRGGEQPASSHKRVKTYEFDGSEQQIHISDTESDNSTRSASPSSDPRIGVHKTYRSTSPYDLVPPV